jgi:hypothetical protein
VTATEIYSKNKLTREISEIQSSKRNLESPELDLYEKALIYKYSEDGYEVVNETLRKSKGKAMTEFGKFLTKVLDKLPDFDGLVYRSANLTKGELKRYTDALSNNELLKEYSFVSTSKSRLIAMVFNGNVLFRIYSRTGKEIEKIAKFGIHGSPNEKEILIKANRNFRLLEITNQPTYTLITMEEV